MSRAIRTVTAMLMLCLAVAGCTSTQNFSTLQVLPRENRSPRILLMQPDVELSELTAHGSLKVNSSWTRQGESYLKQAVREKLGAMNMQYVEFMPPKDETAKTGRLLQWQKLFGAVDTTIYLYHLDEAQRLPTKQGRFEWTLGPSVCDLAHHCDADYALFIWVRDSYISHARRAFKIMAAAALHAFVSGGVQTGHAMLVDLRTGEVVWFNELQPREKGDLRELEPARDVAGLLLDGMPQ